MGDRVVVGTWPFSKVPVSRVCQQLLSDEHNSCVEAVKQGINVAETDPAYGQHFVGCGGPRNSEGRLELDAAIMDGDNLQFGAVLGLQGIPKAISVAADIMKHSPHNVLIQDGARNFAVGRGYQVDQQLLSPIPQLPTKPHGKDTLGIVALSKGNVCAGVTTSGLANKQPGRVGDSPLPGCGLYADSEGGGACCTGDGDEILKHCPSFHTVLLMKQGKTAQEACDEVVADIVRRLRTKSCFEFGMIAVDMKGRTGAAGTVNSYTDPRTGAYYPGFPYMVCRPGDAEPTVLVQAPAVGSCTGPTT